MDTEKPDVPTKFFTPRLYQQELLDEAKERNIIIPLGTGSGKTFIAIMLIREMSADLRVPWESGGKRAFFLVNQVALCIQQATEIRKQTNLVVNEYHGNKNTDQWSERRWNEEIQNSQVMVMTAQIFWDMLNHGFFSLKRANLLIFDECHHACSNSSTNHPYRKIMHRYVELSQDEAPKVLGLSASVISANVTPEKLPQRMEDLETALCSKIVSSSETIAAQYGAKPKITTVECKDFVVEDSSVSKNAKELIKGAENFTRQVDFDPDVDTYPYKPSKPVLIASKQTLAVLEQLGPWCAWKFCEICENKLRKRSTYRITEQFQLFARLGETYIRAAKHVLEPLVGNVNSLESLEAVLPWKVRELLTLLKSYKPETEQPPSTALSGIIFVQQRCVALMLKVLIKSAQRWDDRNLGFLKVDFVVGSSYYNLPTEQQSALHKRQEKVLRGFREKKLNLIISTSVLEEGIDVPQCNCVIRFDPPPDYRSYVQSKGRARQSSSQFFVLFESSKRAKIMQQIKLFSEIEEMLLQRCQDRDDPTDDRLGIDEVDALIPALSPPIIWRPDGSGPQARPRVSMSTAISLINRYCSTLPSDMFTRLVPRCKTEEVIEDGIRRVRASLTLPINCPVREQIQIASAMTDALPVAGNPCYVHVINLEWVPTKDGMINPEDRHIPDPALSSSFLGIVSSKPFPKIPPFPVFTQQEEIIASFKTPVMTSPLSVAEIQLLSQFHQYIFSEVLFLNKACMKFNPNRSESKFFIAPLEGDPSVPSIDFNSIENILEKSTAAATEQKNKAFVYEPKKFRDAIVSPWYGSIENPRNFYVLEVCDDMSPNSEFPGEKYSTFNNYFEEKYDVRISNQHQPLLSVYNISNRLDFTAPRVTGKRQSKAALNGSDPRKNSRKQWLVPELVTVHPVGARMWKLLVLLPSILYRANYLLLADQLRSQVMTEKFGHDSGSVADSYEWEPLRPDNRMKAPTHQPENACEAAINEKRSEIALSRSSEYRDSDEDNNIIEEEKMRDALALEEGRNWKIDESVSALESERSKRDNEVKKSNRSEAGTQDLENDFDDEDIIFDVELSRHVMAIQSYPNSSETIFEAESSISKAYLEEPEHPEVVPSYISDSSANDCSDKAKNDRQDGELRRLPTSESNISLRMGKKRKASVVVSSSKKMREEEIPVEILRIQTSREIKLHLMTDEETSELFESTSSIFPRKYSRSELISIRDRNSLLVDNESVVLERDIEIFDDVSSSYPDESFISGYQTPKPAPCGPNPSLLLRALTMSAANDCINLERLEMLGDSFLKYATTVFLFCSEKSGRMHEGALSCVRSKLVCNLNLYRLGKRRGISDIMVAEKFEPRVNWLPPCYVSVQKEAPTQQFPEEQNLRAQTVLEGSLEDSDRTKERNSKGNFTAKGQQFFANFIHH